MSSLKEIRAIGVHDYDNWVDAKEFTYVPQELRPKDVEIKIEACGICGSDIHMANGDWGRTFLPFAVGHEIIGVVTATGTESRFKVGDRVGVGAQSDSCQSCACCDESHPQHCKKKVGTYKGTYPSGVKTYGGYASHIRVNSDFAFKIPDNIASEHAAPLLCAGVTAVRPMITAGVTKGTKVGVSGIGGIGHIAILFAKALGAEVTAISRTDSKKELAMELGADHYISTDDPDFTTKFENSLDLVINTGLSFSEGAIPDVLKLLKPFGRMIYITAPPVGEKLVLEPFQLLLKSISIGGSDIGSPKDIEYTLKLASEHNIKPMVETIDISEANVKTAWERMTKGDVRFRFVLTGYDKYFG